MSVTSNPVGEAASAARPGPAAVRGNDWRQVAVPAPAAFRPALPVSVVVPCFEAPGALALTLAGLEGQDYPRALFEVVVVDDGSSPPLRVPAPAALPVRIVRQERRGFGLARARNAGARAASHDILVFLDGDVIAEAGLLAAHARWHHAVSDALTLGFCACVSAEGMDAAAVRDRPASLADLLAGRPFDAPWLERHMARTADLTSRHDDAFRAVTGHNLGISRAFFEEVGGFDESFTRYGGEDTELGYRVRMRGGLLVPARDAFGWHQGRWGEGRAGKERDQELQRAKLAHLVADPGFRPSAPGRGYTVPRHVVVIEAGDVPVPIGRLVESAGALLADPEGDIAVCIEAPGDPDARRALEEALGPDPRVRVAPSPAPHSPAPSPPDSRVGISASPASHSPAPSPPDSRVGISASPASHSPAPSPPDSRVGISASPAPHSPAPSPPDSRVGISASPASHSPAPSPPDSRVRISPSPASHSPAPSPPDPRVRISPSPAPHSPAPSPPDSRVGISASPAPHSPAPSPPDSRVGISASPASHSPAPSPPDSRVRISPSPAPHSPAPSPPDSRVGISASPAPHSPVPSPPDSRVGISASPAPHSPAPSPPDPRVRVPAAGAALDAFPVSPFHIALPAGAVPRPGLVRGLRSALGDAATAIAVLGDGTQVSIARAWALHRARRAGGSAADYGEARTIPAARLALDVPVPGRRGSTTRRIPAARLALGRALAPGRRPGGRGAPRSGASPGLRRPPAPGRARGPRGVRAAAARVWAEARHVRGLRTGWRFARWLASGLRWWLRQGGRTGTTRSVSTPLPADPAREGGSPSTRALARPSVAQADPPLGAEIAALGARARAVFAASSRVAHELAGSHVDVVLADTPAQAAGIEAPAITRYEAPGIEAPAVARCEAPALAAPAVVLREAPALEVPAVARCETPELAAPAVALREAPALAVPAVARCEAPALAAPAVARCEAPALAAPAVARCEAPALAAPAVVLREAPALAVPAVILCETPALAVPAFDPALDNPIGWVREVEPRVAALGPPRLLPPGVRAHRAVTAEDRDALRHCHHLEDVAAFHASPPERAGTLARLAARGVPVHLADRDRALPALLGAELHGLMTEELRGAGAAAREARSIAMRRAALRTHSLRARARQVCAAALADPPELARISVLLATRRPGHLAAALANVARQRYPRLELVLALHGPGFEPEAVERAVAGFPHPVKLLRLDASRPLGSVLNAVADAASGALLAKMDDDDLYGPEHLWDLALAREYSGAALVGKFPATVYLARSDRTVRRRRVRSETWSSSITGGATLIGRADLERAGGWRRVPRHVDAALVEDVLRAGGGVYRTHDAGYLMVRHGDRHTWEADDAGFLVEAEAVHRGWRPALAGIEDAPPPDGSDARRDDA